MRDDRPQVGTPILLRDEHGLTYASRVEDVDDELITVARPADLRAAIEYVEGMRFELVWTSDTGIHVLPVDLSAATTDKQIRLWCMTPLGDSWVEQRREYVRVEVKGSITLTPHDADPAAAVDAEPEPIGGTLVDISEVATQCTVPVAPDDERVAADSELRCRFAVNNVDFDLLGKVIITRPGETTQQARLVILFETSPTMADALRKQVFAAQLANRRSGR